MLGGLVINTHYFCLLMIIILYQGRRHQPKSGGLTFSDQLSSVHKRLAKIVSTIVLNTIMVSRSKIFPETQYDKTNKQYN